jgi:hypothetical protein
LIAGSVTVSQSIHRFPLIFVTALPENQAPEDEQHQQHSWHSFNHTISLTAIEDYRDEVHERRTVIPTKNMFLVALLQPVHDKNDCKTSEDH